MALKSFKVFSHELPWGKMAFHWRQAFKLQ